MERQREASLARIGTSEAPGLHPLAAAERPPRGPSGGHTGAQDGGAATMHHGQPCNTLRLCIFFMAINLDVCTPVTIPQAASSSH